MVMRRSIDIDDTDDDYMVGSEEGGVFFSDEDLQHEQQAPTMVEVNPPRKAVTAFQIPWRALRLPGARGSERWVGSEAFSALGKALGGRADDIRSSPYAYVISEKAWRNYVNNMDGQDVAAELSAPVSDFEKASLYLFAEEWRADVTHEAFKRRLIDHPLVNVGSETAKGELVYDLITGQVTAKGGRPNTAYREMLRLAMDILKSIRLRYYNYYTVNLLHSDEGAAVYEEFLNRYVPLEANEVAIIKEIEMGLGAQGRTYAVNTSNPAADALTTYNLMMRVVESYNIGDTMTARAGVSALIQAPINYQSAVRFSVNTDHLGRSHLSREGTVIAVAFTENKKKADASKNPDVHYIVSQSIGENKEEWPLTGGGKTDFNRLFNRNNYGKEMWVKVRSMSDATPTDVIRLTQGTGEVKLNLTPYQDYLKLGDALRQASETIAPPQQQQGNQRPRRGRVQQNPGVMSNVPLEDQFKDTGKAITAAKKRAKAEGRAYYIASLAGAAVGRGSGVGIAPDPQSFYGVQPDFSPFDDILYTVLSSGRVYDDRRRSFLPDDFKPNPGVMSNMPFVQDATGALVPTPGTDKDVVSMFHTLKQNFASQRNQTFMEALRSVTEAEAKLADEERKLLLQIRKMKEEEVEDGGRKDFAEIREIKENKKTIKNLAKALEVHRNNLQMLSQSYAKDLNRATEAARALEQQKLVLKAVDDAIMEVMASGQRAPKARIFGNPVRVGGTKMTPQEVVEVIKAQHVSHGKHRMNSTASLEAAVRKARTSSFPYVIYGSNGYANWNDEMARNEARRLSEPSIVDVPSYVDWANTGDLQDIIVYHFTGQDDGFFPYGIPSKMGWGQLGMTQDEINAARKSSRSNPVTVGQGQHFFIQLRNPSQFKFTAAEKKNAKRSKGTMAIAGKPGTDNTGLRDLLGGFEKGGYVAWKAEHKDSGTRMPWIIQLPRKKGKAGNIVFKKARVTDKDTGRSYSTIKPFTANKKIKAAWEKFIALYGEPIYAENPKKRSLFRIRRKNRGRYYKRK